MDELAFTEAMARLEALRRAMEPKATAPSGEKTSAGKKMCEWCQNKPARLDKNGAHVCGACYFADDLKKGIGQIK